MLTTTTKGYSVTLRRLVSGVGAVVSLAGLLAGSVGAVAVLAWATRWVLMDSARDTSFDVWVGRAAACGAWLAVLWLVVGFSIAVVAAACGSAGELWDRLAMRIAPAGVRRAAHLAAGTVLMSGIVAAPAMPAVARSLSHRLRRRRSYPTSIGHSYRVRRLPPAPLARRVRRAKRLRACRSRTCRQ